LYFPHGSQHVKKNGAGEIGPLPCRNLGRTIGIRETAKARRRGSPPGY
jgi:hypothetical protein